MAGKYTITIRVERPVSVPRFTPGIYCLPVTFSPGIPTYRLAEYKQEDKKEKQETKYENESKP